MRKITSISGSKSSLKCETEYCGLNEAFKQLHFDNTSSTLFSSSYNAAIATHLSNTSGSVSNGVAGILDSVISVSINFSNKTLVPGLILNGTLKFNILSIKYKYDKDKSVFDPKYVLMKADYNTEGSNVSIEFNGSEIKLPEDTVHIFDLPTFRIPIPIPTPVGVVVIPYPFTEKIYATILPLTINGKLKLQIVPVFHGTLGCEYSNGSWKNISTVTRDTLNIGNFCKKDFLISEAITSTLTLFNFKYTIAPLGVASLNTYLETPNNLTLTIQTNSPNYSLQYGLTADVGVELPTFWGIKTKFQATAKLFDTILAKGNWSSCGDTISLSTNQVTSITASSAISGGNIIDSGGSPIIQRGVCWSTLHNPTVANSKTNDGTGIGNFISNIDGLDSNTTYYVRAYATNYDGTTYGNELSFNTTSNADTSTYLAHYWVPGTIINNTMTLMLHFDNGTITGRGLITTYPLWGVVTGTISGTEMNLKFDYDNHVIPECDTLIPQPSGCPQCVLKLFQAGETIGQVEHWDISGVVNSDHSTYNATYVRKLAFTQIVGEADCTFPLVTSTATENGNFTY